ncbi:CamS family sex pheromone protein [Fervidibacillus halotolerans]|uniref:CamS family sex pheromone protein n=1 Tax=Fervidibacillus halotolerans TaxID=2980027 RepID=A0A9E8LZV1_9BACI|nr:CamS family sex pheromone protein [Fervidibacillus halotolerans]WAA12606.1 CamS family sex pheromone protein [Fervidibacillus halotolerans]
MKKIIAVIFLSLLLLSGCLPSVEKQDEVIQEDQEQTDEKAIVPNYQISDSYYRTLIPFEPSDTRGMVLWRLNTRYDSDEFEEGLLRIAQKTFSTDKYIFQDGKYLNKETVQKWLNREFTSEQLKERDLTEAENLGLNPPLSDDADQETIEDHSIYLSYLLEHNYLVKSDENKVKLGGVAIGLALNSVFTYTYDGVEYKKTISDQELEKEGKNIAEEVIRRLRQTKGLETVPITIGLFKQMEDTSVVPGHYFAFATAEKGTSLDWKDMNEEYVLFPSTDAKKNYRDDYNKFESFQLDVTQYFKNYSGIVGRAFYIEKELQKLSIDIHIQFYGKAETIGFAQYITGLIEEHFPDEWTVEVNVTSSTGQEALIVKEPNMDEPFVHIY